MNCIYLYWNRVGAVRYEIISYPIQIGYHSLVFFLLSLVNDTLLSFLLAWSSDSTALHEKNKNYFDIHNSFFQNGKNNSVFLMTKKKKIFALNWSWKGAHSGDYERCCNIYGTDV